MAVGIAAMLGTVSIYIGRGLHEIIAAEDIPVESVRPNAPLNERGLINFEDYRSHEQLRPSLDTDAAGAALHLKSKTGRCTGTIVNGYLVTAAHCGPTGGATLDVTSWQDGHASHGQISRWNANSESDVLIAEVEWDHEPLRGWNIKSFAKKTPEKGKQFITATLPGEVKRPVVSDLTFLGEVLDYDTDFPRWIFAVNPENDPKSGNKVCTPGASGSLVLDGFGSVAILSAVSSKDFMPAEKWSNNLAYYEQIFGVDLQQVSTLCIATPLTKSVWNTYTANLNQRAK